jgi:phage terminase large subunit GpA-like protein
MNERGFALAPGQNVKAGQVTGPEPDTTTYSLWVSGLMTPWVSFGVRAADWLTAAQTGDQEVIRATLNTAFGELYQLRGEAPPWESVRKLGEDYQLGDVPSFVRLVFLTVDVQKDRLVCVVRGWGPEFESALLYVEELWGDTEQLEVYGRLSQLAERQWGERRVNAVAIDSGFRTDQVYTWCHRRGIRAYATKGRERPLRLYSATNVEVDRLGRKLYAGLKLWTIDHDYFKGWVHDRLGWPQDQPGAWRLPRDVTDDYCQQIVAEQRMRLPSGTVQWIKRGVNDYLDCEALQVFLAHIEGVRNLRPQEGRQPVQAGASNFTSIARQLNG